MMNLIQTLGLGVSLLGALALAGCSADGAASTASSSSTTPQVNAGLDQFLPGASTADASTADPSTMSQSDITDWFAKDAAVLPSLASGQLPASPIVSDGSPIHPNLSPTASIENELAADESTDDVHAGADADKVEKAARPTTSVASIEKSSAATRDRLIKDLAAQLRKEVRDSVAPLRQYAVLSALEVLEPGVAPDPTSIPTLTPREVELLSAWRDLFRRADDELSKATGDIGALSVAVAELAQRMGEWETLDITNAALCSRVEGFGQYTPLPGAKMLAGRTNPAIVYIAVDHFTHRASTGPGGESGYLVEMTQELSLYHDADGLLAWRQSSQQIHDFSRNRRRDFFVVQRIDLPKTLSVGAYRLKITMRDKATGAIAEKILPIKMVADASMVRAQ